MEVRELEAGEWLIWLRMRELLWPETSREELIQEQEEIGADPARNVVLVAVNEGTEIVGFAEVSLRDWAEGCSTHPVGYIEAWYVEPEHRRSGVGGRLMDAAEDWARAKGCTEMGSDAELGNEVSRLGHLALGFTEVTRLVLFAKTIVK